MSSTRLPKGRFIAALLRIRAQIKRGLKFEKYDSDEPGAKSTHCSWGLCSENEEQWPNAEDHLWPDKFREHKRVAPKYREDTDECPFAMPRDTAPGCGCFYRCRVFQKKYKTPNREQAVELYTATINQHIS